MNIGPRIKAIRLVAGKTQRQCADAARMSQSMWADLEADRASPTLDTLERVCAGLGVSVLQLFRNT